MLLLHAELENFPTQPTVCLVFLDFTVLILVCLHFHVLLGSIPVFRDSLLVRFVQLDITVLIKLSHQYLAHQELSVFLGALSVWLVLLTSNNLSVYNHCHYFHHSLALMVPSVKLVKEHVLNVLLVTAVTMGHLATNQSLVSLDFTVLEDKLSAFFVHQVLNVTILPVCTCTCIMYA